MYRFGPIQRKIVLALFGGVSLGLCNNSQQYFKTLKTLKKEWKKVEQRSFNRSIYRLTKEKLLEERKLADGSFKLVLTKKGEKQARRLSLLGNSIKFKKPRKWDKKWRIVMFDIPEKDRVFRDVLREHLRELKFYKFQHSVFISPYPFEKPILELISLYQVEKYVRVIIAIKIDNEAKFRKIFFEKNN